MPRAITYTRVSTDGQERDGTSLETQDAACQRYAEEHGYQLVRSIRDTGSGFTLDRAGIEEVREAIRAGTVDVVVAYAVDRLSRNQNQIGVLFDEAERGKVRLEFVTERFEDTAAGRFILAARAFVAEVEREKIAERTSRGRIRNAREGRWVGAMPYGYTRPAKGEIAVDEAQARTVRRIYDLYLDGNLGMLSIARTLNAEGARTLQGSEWATKQVRDVLLNETYAGVMKYADVRIEGRAPVIIERERWEEAQRRRARKAEIQGGKAQVSPYLLSGVLFCGACGSLMSGMSKPSRKAPGRTRYLYRRYVCSRWLRGKGCANVWRRAEDVERAVVDGLNAAGRAVELRRTATRHRESRHERELGEVERLLKRNDERRRNLAQAVMDGVFVGAQARQANEEVEAERRHLESERERIRCELAESTQRDQDESARAERVRMLLDEALPIAEQKAIVQTYVRRIVIYPDEPDPVLEE